LIKTKRNSNHKTRQTTLQGKILQEYVWYVLDFAPANGARLKKDVLFKKLSNVRITIIEQFLESKKTIHIKF
jgi:hypothetical protein